MANLDKRTKLIAAAVLQPQPQSRELQITVGLQRLQLHTTDHRGLHIDSDVCERTLPVDDCEKNVFVICLTIACSILLSSPTPLPLQHITLSNQSSFEQF